MKNMIKKFIVLVFLFYVHSSVAQTDNNSVMLEQPADHDTIQNTGGEVMINISSQLPAGHQWRVLLDGIETGTLQTNNQFTLQNIERGEHTLQVQAIDSNNNVLTSSAILTIYVHQGVSAAQ